MRECIFIFTTEFFAIFVFSILISAILITIITAQVNSVYMEGLENIKYCIIDWNYIVFVVMLCVELVINILSVKIPLRVIRKKNPIQIIN